MNPISQVLSVFEVKKPKELNPRQKSLKRIIDELEKEGKVFKHVVAIKTSHLSLGDLDYLHSVCKSYKLEGKGAYGKCFWGSLKLKK